MRQVVLRAGAPQVVEVPAPSPAPGRVLVAVGSSVISSGTERTAVASGGGGGGMLSRAVRNPELVRKALEHVRERGLRETLDLARGATAPDSALGYSAAGIVLDTGGIPDFRVGQAVACAGAGRANHAEVVSVPGNLVHAVPDGVALRDAAFATLGAIALQGVRRTEPTLGERVVVVGLGLLGLLTVQLLRAAGCPVLGVEPVASRRALAEQLGAERVVAPAEAADAVKAWAPGGADAVVVTASAASDALVNDAVAMVRRRGRVVPVGEIGLGLERAPLYVREADVRISTSYGPGRYDASYEEGGVDYPAAYVRWTENRNMGEFLRLLATGQIRVEPLVDLELPVDRAAEAYAAINGAEPPLAAVMTYDAEATIEARRGAEVVRCSPATPAASDRVRIALVGAGGFVTNVHLPNLKADPRAAVTMVVNRSGTSAGDAARLAGGAVATATDWRAAVEAEDIDLVLVGTRHDSHAEIAAAALRAGKAVFVEKPLGLTRDEIDDVWAAGGGANARLAIGFNRPFAPLLARLGRECRTAEGPIHLVYRVSSPLPADHWLNDPATGGGRILGEACHMYDVANWLCGTPRRVVAAALPSRNGVRTVESSTSTIEYEDGSVATVVYSGVGASSLPKERIEVLRGGRAWILDDFRTLTAHGREDERIEQAAGDKGHAELMARVLGAARGEASWEPGLGAAYAAQAVALATLESIATGESIEVRPSGPAG